MWYNTSMEDFSRLSLTQAKLLIKLVESSDHTAFAEGKSEGGSAKELFLKGYVKPFGKVGRRVRWKLIKPISKKELEFLKDLVK